VKGKIEEIPFDLDVGGYKLFGYSSSSPTYS
jgi:hypothetical protein